MVTVPSDSYTSWKAFQKLQSQISSTHPDYHRTDYPHPNHHDYGYNLSQKGLCFSQIHTLIKYEVPMILFILKQVTIQIP